MPSSATHTDSSGRNSGIWMRLAGYVLVLIGLLAVGFQVGKARRADRGEYYEFRKGGSVWRTRVYGTVLNGRFLLDGKLYALSCDLDGKTSDQYMVIRPGDGFIEFLGGLWSLRALAPWAGPDPDGLANDPKLIRTPPNAAYLNGAASFTDFDGERVTAWRDR